MRRAVRTVDDPEGMPAPVIDQILDDPQLGGRKGGSHQDPPDRKSDRQQGSEGPSGHADDQYAQDKNLIFSPSDLPVQKPGREKDRLEDSLIQTFLHQHSNQPAHKGYDDHNVIQAVHAQFKGI